MGHPGSGVTFRQSMQQHHPQLYVDQMQQRKEQGVQVMMHWPAENIPQQHTVGGFRNLIGSYTFFKISYFVRNEDQVS